jgi:creatinine amidohydrolase
MGDLHPSWSEGLEILRRRQRALPEAVLRAWTVPLDLSGIEFAEYRSVLTTGIGSSFAHAEYLAWLLRNRGGTPAWSVSSGSFMTPPGGEAREQALVVFSQGLSPNARLPLAHVRRFGCTILVTAADAEHGERAAALQRFREAGVVVVPMPVDPEYEVLLRIVGPMVGYVLALRLAARQGVAIDIDPPSLASAITDSANGATALEAPGDPITFVATGGYAGLCSNLCAKVIEGMYLPFPAAVDAMEFAHGFQQEASGKRRTFIALARNAPHEMELFARVRATLEPQHRWLELKARLPEPFQIFEHEAAVNTLVLAAIAARRLDQREWPGKGFDRPLYNVGSLDDLRQTDVPAAEVPQAKSRRLADLTWSEVESRVKAGDTTAVIPLGAFEQHGPHLPLCVDTVVADALAERFCNRVPGALYVPAVQFGCSVEHLAFCGTLSLLPATLGAVLSDLISSVVGHGFKHVVVFSAHGGNDAILAELEPVLKKCAAPARTTIVHGIDKLGKVWSDASAAEGLSKETSGAHAGEFETSIIAGLRSDLIRWQELREGLTAVPADPQTLFYPSLRNHAAEGVVGDPRAAAAERAERYLSAWVDFLIEAYRETAR